MKKNKTKEPQNQVQYNNFKKLGPSEMGVWTSHIWRTDPRHLGFLLARYKFCAKMLEGKSRVMEIGCGDAFGMPVMLQAVKYVHGIDFEPLVLEEAMARQEKEGIKNFELSVHDIVKAPINGKYDAAYAVDVIEHIPRSSEANFMKNICKALFPSGVLIIGTPNLFAQKYGTRASAEGHINLKSADKLRKLMERYFHNVFIFSMNDEVVHTGFSQMAHYLFGVGAGVR